MRESVDILRKEFFLKLFLVIFALSALFLVGCMKAAVDPLTPEERAWLTEHDGKIRLGHDPNANPVDYLDKEGKFKGLAADYVRLIEKRLNFKFDILRIKTWDEVIKKAKNKEVDVLCAFSKSKNREQYMLFTETYITIPVVILVRDDFKGNLTLDTRKDLKVTFTKGWVVDDYLKQKYSHLNMLPAIDADAALNNLVTKRADAWVTALTVASNKIEENRVANVRVAGETDLSFNLAFASRIDRPVLHNILNKGLALITEKERAAIFNKWIHIQQQSIFENRKFWIIFFMIIGISVLPVIIVFIWNKALKRKVEESTKALETELIERRQVQETLKISEERYRSLLENQTDLVCRFLPDGTFVFVNNVYCDFFEKAKEDLIGSSWSPLPVDDDIEMIEKKLSELSPKNPMVTIENRVYSGKGEIHWVQFVNTAIYDSNENLLEIQSVGRDITERKQMEEALRVHVEDLKESQRIAHVGSWHLDVLSNQVVWSEELYRMYGFDSTAPPPPYTEHQKLFTPESWDRLSAALNNTREKGTPYTLELETLRQDGSHGWMWVFGEAVSDKNGRIIGLKGAAQEITERKHAEEKLKQSRDLLVNLACLVPGVIYQYRLNPDGSSAFPWSSPGMNDIYEVTPEEVKEDATPVFGRLHPEDLEMVSNAIQESARTLNTFYCEFRVILPRQGLRWRWSQAQPERTEDGGTLWHGIISDITERKQMETHLQQAYKMESIGNLAGGIAHDFNNILSSIIGYAELTIADVEKGTLLSDNLQEIYTAGLRARDLVKQILAFARQSDEERKPIKIDTIAKEVMNLIRSTIPTTIEIKESIESNLLIMGSPTQVHQLFMNLCTNAAQAMEDAGGILEVGLKDVTLDNESSLTLFDIKPGNYVKVTISDTGPGIAPDILGSIFEPYFTTKGVGEGTGMGLALAHGIVESYGGKITVESELGKGTIFSIYLPITKKSENYRPYEEEKLPSGTERILFVDDELPIAKMGSQILERLGYQVTVRTSSVEGLELFRSKPNEFDLVISDMTMPNMTGDELAMELMRIRSDIPVILCTGYSKKISGDSASAIGIKAFAYKPVVKAELAKTVRKVLDEAQGSVQG